MDLLKDGTIGEAGTFEFVPAEVISKTLKDTGGMMCLTVGLSFRNPRIRDVVMSTREATTWLGNCGKSYVFEARYVDGDQYLHVTALSGNDLF